MALLRLVAKSFETAGHGIATGATAFADEVTGRQVPELRHARQDQEQRMQAAARGVEENARVVGDDMARVIGTTGVSIAVLGQIVSNPNQLKRLVELIETHDFHALVRALQPGAQLPNDFFPRWILRAGGYFPKFAQVLSVRADLIHNPEVLEQLGRCNENMPAQPPQAAKQHLLSLGWDSRICDGVGGNLNAGSVAQVNELMMPDGTTVVVKIAWPDTRRKMETDFRLFVHARRILSVLRLDDEGSNIVAAIFSVVGKNEENVLREFDMEAEACVLDMAGTLCARHGEWDSAYQVWLAQAETSLASAPPLMSMFALTFVHQMRSSEWRVQVPEPVRTCVNYSAFAMSRAGGQSLHALLAGDANEQRTAVSVFVGLAVPFIGWLLLCKSSSHIAHADPHLGNFRWDDTTHTMWVLDWGSNVALPPDIRRALCMLVSGIAGGANDETVAQTARSLGIRSDNSSELAKLMRGMMNASAHASARDALNTAALDSILDDVGDDIVPVVRCLATLGGILKEVQRRVNDEHHQNVELSLASLWRPFAEMGLQC